MPPSRIPPHEALTSHAQTSHPSLRPSTSATSVRTRQQHDLFAPNPSRRHGGRTTPRIEDEVLADSESEHDLAPNGRQRHTTGNRHASPEGRHLRARGGRQQAQEQDIVNRKPDGSYLLDGTTGGSAVSGASTLFAQGQAADSPGRCRYAKHGARMLRSCRGPASVRCRRGSQILHFRCTSGQEDQQADRGW